MTTNSIRGHAGRCGVVLLLAFVGVWLTGCQMFKSSSSQPEFTDVPGMPAARPATADPQPAPAAASVGQQAPASGSRPAGEFSSGTTAILHAGDPMSVVFSGIDPAPPTLTLRVNDDGTITLPYVGSVAAVNKTPGQLQKDIHDAYVPKIYPQWLAVTVLVGDQYYYVGGEVKASGKFPWVSDMTLLKAIQTAGDFTDFAKKSKVKLFHGNKVETVNCKKIIYQPWLDKKIYPGDRILVPRRIF